MPRIRPLDYDEVAERHKRIAGKIREYQHVTGCELEFIAKAAGIHVKTLRLRLKDPGTFTARELARIAKKLKIPCDEINQYIC